MSKQSAINKAYEHSINDCVIIDYTFSKCLWALGNDRLDLLHRLSTNSVVDMSNLEAKPTTLTNPVGRIIDQIFVINMKNKTLLVSDSAKSDLVRQWIARHIFFQDDVILETPKIPLVHTVFLGPKSNKTLHKTLSLPKNTSPNFAIALDNSAWLIKMNPPAGIGYRLIADIKTSNQIINGAVNNGAERGSSALYEILRVEAGLPGAGSEITPDYIPLEAGLRQSICFTKGCYTGQEIIARMDSQGKLAKTLVGLKSTTEIPVGSTLQKHNKICGTVTSSVFSPNLGWLSLAFIKPLHSTPGTDLSLSGDNKSVVATVSNIPFKN